MPVTCKLSTILGEKRLKMSDVVRGTGLAKNTVLALYHDRVRKVDYHVLGKLCAFLNCQVGDLLVFVPDGGDQEDQQTQPEDAREAKKTRGPRAKGPNPRIGP